MEKLFKNDESGSERKVFTQEFTSLDEAIKRMNAFKYGVINKSKFGGCSFTIGEEPRDDTNDLYFESETKHGFYYYTIQDHNEFFRLEIHQTRKHKMITAAIKGDIQMFVENFANTDKMKGFALSTAISSGHWNIVKYLTENHDLKNRPVWEAIRYNKVEIAIHLLDNGHKLPKDWLAYCMYSDSIDVARELLLRRKAHLKFSTNELKTNWFQREINKQSRTAEFVKKHLE